MENERGLDAQGNVCIRNTYDMTYNDRNLLIGYESDTTDSLKNKTHWRT